MLNHLNDAESSIVTAEDPVEYVIDGIAQCSINPQINVTFEETLRHMMRQDPDVIVLGEIRDKFSAETVIQAALTGHKVLTTFHTEDTIGGLLRLMNMDIEAFLISSTVVSVLAQRLLRRVCSSCVTDYQPGPMELQWLGYVAADLAGATFKTGRGCERCRFSGYSGRVGIFELLVLNEMVKDAILNRRTSYDIRRVSVESSSLVTLLEDERHQGGSRADDPDRSAAPSATARSAAAAAGAETTDRPVKHECRQTIERTDRRAGQSLGPQPAAAQSGGARTAADIAG